MSTDRFADPQGGAAPIHRLSNGHYEVLIADTGAGRSNWDWIALTRASADAVQDALGSVLYLRDLDDGRYWSVGYQPTRTPTPDYRTELTDGCFSLEREDDGIAARLAVSVDAAADLEYRRLTLTNRSERPRRLEVTSYLEVVLAHPAGDAAHPAFSKLFVETERDAATGALLARRRPRAAGEHWPWLVHALVGAGAREWETDRMRFLGRGRTPAAPAALAAGAPLSGTVGSVLDPVFSLRTRVELAAGATAELCFLTGVAPDRAAALALIAPPAGSAELQLGDALAVPRPPVPPQEPASGYGAFSPDGREYVIELRRQADGTLRRPPLPWINVIANERAGCLVSEVGAGYTWARNSQANRLTPWSNDPVIDPFGEALYLLDQDTGACWSPLPGPRPAPCDYQVRHGFGYSVFRCDAADLTQETTLFVPRADPLRVLHLRLTNHGSRARTLAVVAYQQLVMGNQPVSPSPIYTAYDDARDLLTATNPAAGDFADGRVFAFAVVSGGVAGATSYTGDRAGFIGRHGDLSDPAALRRGDPGRDAGTQAMDGIPATSTNSPNTLERSTSPLLDGRCGAGLDPCLAQKVTLTLAPGETAQCSFLLGECLSKAELDALLARYRQPGAIDQALAAARGFWADLVGRLQVETPVPAIDLMLNGWLVYQNLSCRIWARSAFYQSGGAFGYRDQLQDSAALAMLRPDLTRAQILLHAAHQFVEGDVLHWWHAAPMECGLRTRFADDLLWLPFVTSHYIRITGDGAILDESAPYLTARALEPGEDETFLKPTPSGESGDLYDHCCRVLDRSLTLGIHGLPLMGTGDWNDGMNRIGREGRGESVWMGFFLYRCLGDFLPLCTARGDAARVTRYTDYRAVLVLALEESGWDGAWYRRAYYDDGTPLGCATDDECRIDALAQSWAAISGAVPRARAQQALDALEAELISEEERLIRLLTPPFVDTPHDPGYIKGYLAGVRENGGQYTHAACWAVMAMAELGLTERAARLLAMLSPVSHTATPAGVETYRLEPYAVAADIYGTAPHIGRGGWSWYTGSAGWMYRVGIESVLGLRVEDGRTLILKPCIPADWPGFRIHYRLPDGLTVCEIAVDNGGAGQVVAASLDGQPSLVSEGAARITLPAVGGTYRWEVRLG
ncbi:glycosyl transferase [uncultured Thiodictyon sp.]|uniref:GH36-type glycosyl hydrolase domain-containing protein n=2 Tax=uncultured Thiodictyon sp. TaxID=1846217 RepID=UPI0025FABE0A|nr:glycosyl transferase [uncultured Thiodictyon sp.]